MSPLVRLRGPMRPKNHKNRSMRNYSDSGRMDVGVAPADLFALLQSTEVGHSEQPYFQNPASPRFDFLREETHCRQVRWYTPDADT